jgi:hypothetical protein
MLVEVDQEVLFKLDILPIVQVVELEVVEVEELDLLPLKPQKVVLVMEQPISEAVVVAVEEIGPEVEWLEELVVVGLLFFHIPQIVLLM